MRTKKTFVYLLKQGLEKKDCSLRLVAKKVGLDPSYLSKVIAFKRSPPSDEKILKKLAQILEIDPLLFVISSGLIPSEIQPLMESPRFFDWIGPAKEEGISRPRPKMESYHRKGTQELSEDLL